MKSFTYTIQDELGIHANPAGTRPKSDPKCKSFVPIDNETKKADAKRRMAKMTMGVKKEYTVTFTAESE